MPCGSTWPATTTARPGATIRTSWSRPDAWPAKLRTAVAAVGGPAGDRTRFLDPEPARAAFARAMDDDLDTPAAIAALSRLADGTLAAARAGEQVAAAQEGLRQMGRVFGLRLDAAGPEERVVQGWNRHLERFQAPWTPEPACDGYVNGPGGQNRPQEGTWSPPCRKRQPKGLYVCIV